MHEVNIHEAKSRLSRLIREALEGEEVIIKKGDKPVVRLEVLPEARPGRRLGGAAGLVLWMAEGFDAPLDDFAAYKQR